MKTASTDLFDLVHSLDHNEKRHFQLFTSLQKGNKTYLRLFQTINNQKVYNEKQIRTKHRGEKFIRQLPVAKNYLRALILKSLRVYKENTNYSIQLRNQINEAEILLERKLYDQAIQLLHKIIKLAEEIDAMEIAVDALNQLRMTSHFSKSYSSEKQFNYLFEKQSEMFDKLRNKQDYIELAIRTQKVLYNYRLRKEKKESERLKNLLRHPLYTSEKKALSNFTKLRFYGFHVTYHFINENYIKAHEYSAKALQFFESRSPKYLERQAMLLATNISSHTIVCTRAKKYTEAAENIHKLLNFSKETRNKNFKLYACYYYFDLLFSIHAAKGEFKNSIGKMAEVEALMRENKEAVSSVMKNTFHYHFAHAYFGVGDFKKALKHINELINDKVEKEIPVFFQHGKIMSMLIHYELKNYSLLEHLAVSVKRIFVPDLFVAEKLLIDFFIKEMQTISTSNRINRLKELKQKLISKTNTGVLEYFDFIAWIDSKIKNISYAEQLKSAVKKES